MEQVQKANRKRILIEGGLKRSIKKINTLASLENDEDAKACLKQVFFIIFYSLKILSVHLLPDVPKIYKSFFQMSHDLCSYLDYKERMGKAEIVKLLLLHNESNGTQITLEEFLEQEQMRE